MWGCGRCGCSGSSAQALAVLHPRKLTVYSFSAEGGVGMSAAYYKMTKAYEHNLGVGGLHFTSYNMCYGGFGGVHGALLLLLLGCAAPSACVHDTAQRTTWRYLFPVRLVLRVWHGCAGRDYICVQSMDGQLAFFEQDHPSFTRQLERCLVPGPIVYVPKTDSIVTGTCEMTIESYKYDREVVAPRCCAAPRLMCGLVLVAGTKCLLQRPWRTPQNAVMTRTVPQQPVGPSPRLGAPSRWTGSSTSASTSTPSSWGASPSP